MALEGSTLGAQIEDGGVNFAVWSQAAERIWVSLFDEQDREFDRIELGKGAGGVHSRFVAGLGEGARYGFRADGPYEPANGIWFDPDKLLIDPYALAIDRPFAYDARLSAPRDGAIDTAFMMPKGLVSAPLPRVEQGAPVFPEGGFIYELNVRGFTMRHPDVPEELRGTIAALAHPAIIEHLTKLRVDAVELMPIAAWMDERHLPPLGLANAWGYNPVTFMALDPRIAPGGWNELRETVAALRAAGIGTILDVVFNHTAESDAHGPTLSLRGLDSRAYYRHAGGEPARLVNDTGTGNTLDCTHPAVIRLVTDTLRTFVRHAGVDGFRFDLAPILGRNEHGFDAHAPLLEAMSDDPGIGSRVLIAEPWDIGPGGYQLGRFPPPFLEWNDRFRDDVRRFWRGDGWAVGALATRLAGSSDVFGASGQNTRTVNFIAAHDGMTLADITAYERKHNLANGEDGRDGHSDNLSWNDGVEGATDDPGIVEKRRSDVKALLATLFLSRGAMLLTAGDEFGRTQAGNNNAYAQDNEITWLDWEGRDREIEAFARWLGGARHRIAALRKTAFLDEGSVVWLREDGLPMSISDWEDRGRRTLAMVLAGEDGAPRIGIAINGLSQPVKFRLPDTGDAAWRALVASRPAEENEGGSFALAARSVVLFEETAA
ncbi:glycogen debranching protein GlgX [Mesorhizobium sp. CAU 1732]|uniref:glycogen debranching protein GlgX n=1 Tax=Mesorhizobium sp. CAU 1732 TaxID=3140358 RepID=UPI0032611E52